MSRCHASTVFMYISEVLDCSEYAPRSRCELIMSAIRPSTRPPFRLSPAYITTRRRPRQVRPRSRPDQECGRCSSRISGCMDSHDHCSPTVYVDSGAHPRRNTCRRRPRFYHPIDQELGSIDVGSCNSGYARCRVQDSIHPARSRSGNRHNPGTYRCV